MTNVNKVLSQNLRKLLGREGVSVSQAARDMDLNRTQFNRYLYGESWPRPFVLKTLCKYFGTDGRVVLEPVEDFMGDEAFAQDKETA